MKWELAIGYCWQMLVQEKVFCFFRERTDMRALTRARKFS